MADQRAAILQLWESGNSKRAIARLLECHRSSVQRVIQRHEANEAPGHSTGRPRSARTQNLTRRVTRKIRRNPERQIRKLGRDHEVGATTMHRLVRVDLGLKSLKKTTVPLQTEQAKQRRLLRSGTLLRAIDEHDEVVYTDEKKFCISQKWNHQNDRILAPSQKDVPAELRQVARQKNAASVMVWAGVSANWKSELVFIPQGLKINAAAYQQHILNGPVLRAARGEFHGRNWLFTQDGAPCHTAGTTRRWFVDNDVPLLADWPPNSPDLNPMDFYVWNELETAACSQQHPTINSLKKALVRAWEAIPQVTIAKACRSVHKRIRQVIAADGLNVG